MKIKQWEDKNLSHFSYAVLSECENKVVFIDPARNASQYIEYAKENNAEIVGIIETHPHADFVSSHLELHQKTGAPIYTHSMVGASYPHKAFDEGETLSFGKIKLTSLHTPGHSPDGISIVLEHEGKQKAVFTGDTLFIGDCGRPDLREGAGNVQSKREDLARQMYHSLRDKLMKLDDDVLVYPAHGAGTLCGKNLSKESSSTIGQEKQTNWSLQEATEEEFVQNLLADQPFVPAYFGYDVEMNRKGAPAMQESLAKVMVEATQPDVTDGAIVIDVRGEDDFKKGHIPGAVNLMEKGKFETWLGSIVKPNESFYLAGESEEQLQRVLERVAAIGYEPFVKQAFVVSKGDATDPELDLGKFKENKDAYTIVDVRNTGEVKQKKIFENSIAIPLAELRERTSEIPTDKPIVVHCAGGYRSAAGSSLIKASLNGETKVYDLSEDIKSFQ